MALVEPILLSTATVPATLTGAVDKSNLTYTFVLFPQTLLFTPPAGLPYMLLFRNGVLQEEGVDYTTGPTTESPATNFITVPLYGTDDVLTARFFAQGVTRYHLYPPPGDATLHSQVVPPAIWLQFGAMAPTLPLLLFRNGILLSPFVDYVPTAPFIGLFAFPGTDDTFVVLQDVGGSLSTTANGTITGTVDGINNAFLAPFTLGEMMVFRNGVLQTLTKDYIRVGGLILFVTGQIPQPGDVVSALTFSTNSPVALSTYNGDFASPATASSSWLFRNGVLMTQPFDGTTTATQAVFDPFQVPRVGDSVQVTAWVQDPTDVNQPALNLSRQFSTADGSLIGEVNQLNNVYTLRTGDLVTDLCVFWNGVFQTETVDYTWTRTQAQYGGPWTTTVTLMGIQPRPGDVVTVEAFGQ